MAISEETYFKVLSIADQCEGQQDIATRLGYSIGKINFIVKALSDKGLIKMTNFATSTKKRNYRYLLTPQGINEKLDLTEKFIVRKKAEYEALQQQLQETRALLNQNGNLS